MNVQLGSAAILIAVVSSDTALCPIDNIVVLNMPDGTTMNQTHLETTVDTDVSNAQIQA